MAGDFNRIELVVAPDIIIILCVAGKRWRSTVFLWSSHLSLSPSRFVTMFRLGDARGNALQKKLVSKLLLFSWESVCYVIMWWLIADETMFGFGLGFVLFFVYYFIPFFFTSFFSQSTFDVVDDSILYLLLIISTAACCPNSILDFSLRPLFSSSRSMHSNIRRSHASPGMRWYSWRRAQSHARVYHFDAAARNIDVEKDKMNSMFGFWLMCWGISRRPNINSADVGENRIQAHFAYGYNYEPTTYRKGT